MKDSTISLINETLIRYPKLESIKDGIVKAITAMSCKGCRVLICGNGGSSADGEHIVGELMKEFKLKRPIMAEFEKKFVKLFPEDKALSQKLQGAIPAINLSSHTSLITAFINDVGAEYIYAQQVYGYCEKGDILIALSTSGNALNVINKFRSDVLLKIFRQIVE